MSDREQSRPRSITRIDKPDTDIPPEWVSFVAEVLNAEFGEVPLAELKDDDQKRYAAIARYLIRALWPHMRRRSFDEAWVVMQGLVDLTR